VVVLLGLVVWRCFCNGAVVFLCLAWWCFCGGGVAVFLVAPFFNSTPFFSAPLSVGIGPFEHEGKDSLAPLVLHALSKWEVMGSIHRGGLLLWWWCGVFFCGGVVAFLWCFCGVFVVVAWLCLCCGCVFVVV